MAKSVIVGTAGHIDHGKTALVKALTGIDADRLEEEKRRGITIDIGFAHMELPDANGHSTNFGFVDVPGHEKFIRNMLAGIGGIDLVLLVISADEGIKPQTREHFEICKLLGISRGITVLTKVDKVSGDALVSVLTDVKQFLQGSFLDTGRAPVIPVSALSRRGIDELKHAMAELGRTLPARDLTGVPRLPIDRVFTMKGFGTVVTGTLSAAAVRLGDELEVLPTGKRARVRGVQVHNVAVEAAQAGERTALNLVGLEKSGLARGMTLVAPAVLRTTTLADVRLTMLLDRAFPKPGTRFHLHSFTAETIATVTRTAANKGSVRMRLAKPMLLLPGDRFILRNFSPVVTIGGGVVLDASPLEGAKNWSEDFLQTMHEGDDSAKLLARIERRGQNGLALTDAVAETGWPRERMEAMAAGLVAPGQIVAAPEVMISAKHFADAARNILDSIAAFHQSNPLVPGVGREELRKRARLQTPAFESAVHQLLGEKRIEEADEKLRLSGHTVVLRDDEEQARQTIENAFASAGLSVPALKDVLASLPLDKARAQKIVTLLLRDHILVKLGDELVFHKSALDSLRSTMRDYKTKAPTIDVLRFKEITNVTRKYAIPLLEFLDRERVTRRQGDVRVIL